MTKRLQKQEPPFAMQIEPTEGCSLACSFCGISSIRDNGADAEAGIHGTKASGPFKFMTKETARTIARKIAQAGWNPRIEFAMHGEPTLNKDLPDIIFTFRTYLPNASLMLTSNGSGLQTEDKIMSYFDAGLNTLAVDMYKHSKLHENIVKMVNHIYIEHGIFTTNYPDDKSATPHERYTGTRIILIRDIADNTDGTHTLTNQGGNSFAAAAEPLEQRCAKPFRELSIRWDGNVALCCDDWRGDYKVGNILGIETLEELWNNDRFHSARRFLYQGSRKDIKVCKGCNVRTYRNGLLPDKKGKEDMPKPTGNDHTTVALAQRGKVFSIKVIK